MKRLYIFAGGTDGYVDIHYTLDEDIAERFASDIEECKIEGDWSGKDWIYVPDDSTYESLGIDAIECDKYDNGDDDYE